MTAPEFTLPELPIAFFGQCRQQGDRLLSGSWFTGQQMHAYATEATQPLLTKADRLTDLIEEQKRTIRALMVGSGDETLPVIRRIAELERDAERYQWLRAKVVSPTDGLSIAKVGAFELESFEFESWNVDDLDKMIDVAIADERSRTW